MLPLQAPSSRSYRFIERHGFGFRVKLIDVFPDDYQYPETGNKLPNGQTGKNEGADTSAACVFAPGGYQMLPAW